MENWAASRYVGNSLEETAQMNAAALGQVDLLSRLMEARVEDMAEVKDDRK